MKKFLSVMYHASDEELEAIRCRLEGGYRHKNKVYSGFKEVCRKDLRYDVCVDGELYNIKELRKALRAYGEDVKEAGLEELVLCAYCVWGHGCLLRFNGAFSLMIDDGNEIFVAKDPMGLKPIYYAKRHHRGLSVANEIGLLLKHGDVKAEMDLMNVQEMFAFGPSISENQTLLKGIYALPMGHYMIIKNDNIHIRKYYEPISKPHFDDPEDTIMKVRSLVQDAVRRQSEGCNAGFLSGGLDSSIIVQECSRAKDQFHTYSLDYEGNAQSFVGNMYQVSMDNDYIKEMVDRTGSLHQMLTIQQQELVDTLDDAVYYREMPGMADVDASLLWLCRKIKEQGQDVILSGECSDEVFGGYPWFYKEELKDLDTFPWLRSIKERLSILHPSLQDIDFEAYIQKQYRATLQSVQFLEEDNEDDRRARMHTMLCLHWFMQTLVTRQVRMGEGAGMNIRAPFADVRILDYVYNIPWDLKFYGKEEKGILRKAFESELPADIAHRKKNPFPKTHNPQYTELICEKLRKVYEDESSILHRLLDDDKWKELLDSKGESFPLPWYGQLMSGPQLLAYLYQIDAWSRQYYVHCML